jgi:hypothetical protein
MPNNASYIPFSQRNGYAEVPPQLEFGEVSATLRRLLDYAISKEIAREARSGTMHAYFPSDWDGLAQDFHVRFLELPARSYENSPHDFSSSCHRICERGTIERLFDAVEFFARHRVASAELKSNLEGAFIEARAAYRLIDHQVIAIGTEEQGEAVEIALNAAEEYGANPARSHLVRSGAALRSGDWSGSIRESIHAVESVARRLSPDSNTLGPALAELHRRGHMHPALKNAFSTLYGYTNDEQGLRHANVFDNTANVDEADALFMLGACASFVSYLLARSS